MTALKHHDHSAVYAGAYPVLQEFRQRLMIPPRWTIKLEVYCDDDMPKAYGSVTWRNIPNGSFRIAIRCTLSEEHRNWVIAHELMEAVLSTYGDFTDKLIDKVPGRSLRNYMGRQHGDLRDEVIEWMLRILLQTERPDDWGHIKDF